GGDDGVWVWALASGHVIAHPPLAVGPVEDLMFSPDNRTLAVAAGDAVQLRDASSGQPVGQPFPATKVRSVAFSADGDRLATNGRYDNDVRIWDARTGHAVGSPLTHTTPVVAFAF